MSYDDPEWGGKDGKLPDIGQLQRERIAALLGKWSRGQRLTGEEHGEISHLLPKAGADPSPGEAGAQCAPAKPIPEARLTVRPKYAKKLQDYCEQMGVGSDRTLKRWIAIGKQAVPPDFPPLDSPEQMALWWKRRMKHRIPARLQVISEPKEEKGGVGAEKKNVGGRGGGISGAEITLPEGSGYEAELNRIRHDTRVAAAERDAAKLSGDQVEFQSKSAQYEAQLKLLREFERDAGKIRQSLGDLLPRQKVEMVIREKHGALAQSLRALVETVGPEIERVTDRDARRKVWNEALDRVFVHLDTRRWDEAWSPAK